MLLWKKAEKTGISGTEVPQTGLFWTACGWKKEKRKSSWTERRSVFPGGVSIFIQTAQEVPFKTEMFGDERMDELRDFLRSRGKITLTLVVVNILIFFVMDFRGNTENGATCWRTERLMGR